MTQTLPALRVLPPTAPPTGAMTRLTTVFREADVGSSVLDMLQALQAKIRTQYLLQRKLDAMRADKGFATKELGRAVKSAWEAVSKQCTAEVWTPVDDALHRLDAGKPTEADLKLVAGWAKEMRSKYLRHDAALAQKASRLAAIKGRIEDLEFALRRIILDTGAGEPAPQQGPQMDLPGTPPAAPPQQSAWHGDQRTRRVVVDVVAEEVTSARRVVADEAATDEARAKARAQAEADDALAAALRAMGIGDEPEDGEDEDFEAPDDEDTIEVSDDGEDEEDAEIEAASEHSALRMPPKAKGRGRANK